MKARYLKAFILVFVALLTITINNSIATAEENRFHEIISSSENEQYEETLEMYNGFYRIRTRPKLSSQLNSDSVSARSFNLSAENALSNVEIMDLKNILYYNI